MSKSSVQQVIQRAVSDAAFRRQLQREPAKALAGFDLTAEERSSITGGDPARLTALGVDQRMSKAFALGAAADASTSVNASSIDNIGTSGSAAFIDEGTTSGVTRGLLGDSTTGATSGITGDTTSGATSVFASDPTSGATSVNVGDATSGATASVVDGSGPVLDPGFVSDPTSGSATIIPDPGTAGISAFEDVDTSGDMNVIDPGLLGSTASTVNAWDTDPLTGTMMQDDNGGPTSQSLDEGSGLDTGGDVHPNEF
jgi:hypothetical protein